MRRGHRAGGGHLTDAVDLLADGDVALRVDRAARELGGTGADGDDGWHEEQHHDDAVDQERAEPSTHAGVLHRRHRGGAVGGRVPRRGRSDEGPGRGWRREAWGGGGGGRSDMPAEATQPTRSQGRPRLPGPVAPGRDRLRPPAAGEAPAGRRVGVRARRPPAATTPRWRRRWRPPPRRWVSGRSPSAECPHSGTLPCLRLRQLLALGAQHLEAGDELDAGLGRVDHVVDVAALGRDVRVGEALGVLVDQLGPLGDRVVGAVCSSLR